MQRAHCVRGAPLPIMRYISKVYKVYSLVRTKFLSSRPYCPSAYAREFCGPLLYYEKGPIIKFNFGNESCQNISKVGRVSVLNIFDKKFQKMFILTLFPRNSVLAVECPVATSEKCFHFSQLEDLSDDFNCCQFLLN